MQTKIIFIALKNIEIDMQQKWFIIQTVIITAKRSQLIYSWKYDNRESHRYFDKIEKIRFQNWTIQNWCPRWGPRYTGKIGKENKQWNQTKRLLSVKID